MIDFGNGGRDGYMPGDQMTKPTQNLRDRFPCRPRRCDWCNKRGLIVDPLTRLYVKSDRLSEPNEAPDEYFFWVHKSCAKIILEDETVISFWDFGPYPK